jgi:RND superfamily putative drug exporter
VAALIPVILTAGLIIAGASLSLLVADLGFLRAFGPGMAITAVVGVLVGVTFVPAALAVAGRAMLWPKGAGRGSAEADREPLAGRVIGRRPVLALLGTLALLALLAIGILRLDVGDPLLHGLPKSNDVREGYQTASRDFAPGIVSPVLILVEGDDLSRDDAQLEELEAEIGRAPGVVAAIGPGSLGAAPAGVLVDETGTAARYLAVLSTNPLGEKAIKRVRGLRADLPGMLRRAGLGDATGGIGGDTALISETVDRTKDSLEEVAPVALVVVLILLVVLLRAIVAPLVLVAASALALIAALGATSFVLEDLVGYDEITFFVPFAAAILLLALGSDYNVLLARRIWDESRDHPFRAAVRIATDRASGTIATAGIILALSFAALALIPVRSFEELGFAMALGLLLDAFVVRTLLIPAAIALIGPRAAWPGKPWRERREERPD